MGPKSQRNGRMGWDEDERTVEWGKGSLLKSRMEVKGFNLLWISTRQRKCGWGRKSGWYYAYPYRGEPPNRMGSPLQLMIVCTILTLLFETLPRKTRKIQTEGSVVGISTSIK